jgi:hypothetical protein
MRVQQKLEDEKAVYSELLRSGPMQGTAVRYWLYQWIHEIDAKLEGACADVASRF